MPDSKQVHNYPTYTIEEKAEVAKKVYRFVWQQSAAGIYP